MADETACVILCGGRGTRMRSTETHKVCFPIAGAPAIHRLVATYRGCGIDRIVLVVGSMAGQVVATVGRKYPDTLFVYQDRQLGTGHAARIGAAACQRMGHTGPILITMGDKVAQPGVIDRMREDFIRRSADMIFATGDKAHNPESGRIYVDADGRIAADLEVRDLQRARIEQKVLAALKRHRTLSRERFEQLASEFIHPFVKVRKALPALCEALEKASPLPAARVLELLGEHPGLLEVDGQRLGPDEVEHGSPTVNLSLYLGRGEVMYALLNQLDNDNAQGEYYLTQLIDLMASARNADGRPLYKLSQLTLDDPTDLMGFNNPEDLLVIEEALRRKQRRRTPERRVRLSRKVYRPARQWLEAMANNPPALRRQLRRIYGPDDALIDRRRAAVAKVLKLFARRYGADTRCVVARAPGRVNLMGRHVDHRGGHVNVMAIDREVVFVAAPRSDDVIRLANTDRRAFGPREFRIADMIEPMAWDDWLSYVNSATVQQLVRRSAGEWSNYVRAAVLRLQQHYKDVRVQGMDCAVTGNVPMAAGLSSSSALVVAAAEAAVALNQFDMTPAQFVDLCGEGEWFVGSRGGAADHAAIRLGQRGSVAQVSFFPFAVGQLVQFPDDMVMVVANSGIRAAKSEGARDRFNQRVAGYELGFMLLKDRLPRYDHLLEHVRDINPRRLNCSLKDLYTMLQQVPERLGRKEIVDALSARHRDRLERLFGSHADPDAYELRSVLLYGAAECERSRRCAELLETGRIEELGLMMKVSHDGDRVSATNARGRPVPHDWHVPDEYLRRRIEDLASEDPDRVLRGQLHMQPGGYACSTSQIDQMVDICLTTPGVLGAQLAGAGLGGCIMALVRKDAVAALQRALKKQYYAPAGIKPGIIVCSPVQGSGLLHL